MSLLPLYALLMAGCTAPKPGADADTAELDSTPVETGDTHDSPGDTGDSGEETADTEDSGETGDTGDTGDTGADEGPRWVALSADWNAAALTSDGSVVCWGDPDTMNLHCPTEPMAQVAMGTIHGCALATDGSVTCWGADGTNPEYADWERGQADAPEGSYASVAAGKLQSCALDAEGALTCWGDEDGPSTFGLPTTGRFLQVSLGTAFGCALTRAGAIECWGSNSHGQSDPPSGDGWAHITAGGDHACALDADGFATCWGGIDWRVTDAPTDVQFLTIEAGGDATCGITIDHVPLCWEYYQIYGYASPVLDSPPAGTYVAIEVAYPVALAITEIGDIIAFGDVRSSDLANIPDLPQ